MPTKERLSAGDVCPLGKAFAPPCVIFGDGVILWEVEGNRLHVAVCYQIFAAVSMSSVGCHVAATKHGTITYR